MALIVAGCGPVGYRASLAEANDAVQRARDAGAVDDAPFEFTYAELHLDKAREEAAEASYQDAIRLADAAANYARKAAALSEQRRARSAGDEATVR